ncbi:Homeobox-like_domain superfamily [Hexamita inflata]|uniref:Homeobox-like domain superfamily n=1 Tax=Hexamita inflata TaxID=28002 RepID=A0AA86QGT6_9EUKA|nr:Homeobox-like domain superfamily [Hexamita inflata]
MPKKFHRRRLTEQDKKLFLEKYKQGVSMQELVSEFQIQLGTYRQWTKKIDDGKNFFNHKPWGRSTVLTQQIKEFITQQFDQVTNNSLRFLQKKIKDQFDITIGTETIRLYLKANNLTSGMYLIIKYIAEFQFEKPFIW